MKDLITKYLGEFIGILGILTAVYFALKNRKIKQLSYQNKSFDLIDDEISKIENFDVLYNGERIKDLTVSKIYLWNSGNTIIYNSDIASKDRIRCVFPDSAILNSKIIAVADDACNIRLGEKQTGGILPIEFEYLEKNQGVVINVLHTEMKRIRNENDKEESDEIKLVGKIKDGKIKNRTNEKYGTWLSSLFDGIFPLIFLIVSISTSVTIFSHINWAAWIEWILGISLVAILISFFTLILEYTKKIVLKGMLGKLNEEYKKEFATRNF